MPSRLCHGPYRGPGALWLPLRERPATWVTGTSILRKICLECNYFTMVWVQRKVEWAAWPHTWRTSRSRSMRRRARGGPLWRPAQPPRPPGEPSLHGLRLANAVECTQHMGVWPACTFPLPCFAQCNWVHRPLCPSRGELGFVGDLGAREVRAVFPPLDQWGFAHPMYVLSSTDGAQPPAKRRRRR